MEPKPNVRGWVHYAAESERPWARMWTTKDGKRRIETVKLYGESQESFPSECGVLVRVTHVTLAAEEVTCPRCQEKLSGEVERVLLAHGAKVGQSSQR